MRLGVDSGGFEREALVGRLPVLPGERVYKGYWSFLWTVTSFQAATWAFLIGSFLPYVGNTLVGIVSLIAGIGLGMVLVVLGAAIPNTRYGVDNVDGSKTFFGTRGSIIPLVVLLITMLGWTFVLYSMTSRMLAGAIQYALGAASIDESTVVWFALALGVIVWFLAVWGPRLVMHISNWLAPGILLVSTLVLVLLVVRFGLHPFTANVAPDLALADTKWKQVLIGMEFGLATAFTFWPMAGGLSRLVQKQRHVTGPFVIGAAVLSMGFICGISALAASQFGTSDAIVWMYEIGGRIAGPAILFFIVLHNIAPMVVMIYIAGVALQQIPAATRLKWPVIVAILMSPAVVIAFRTDWVVTHVMTYLSYNGVIMAAIVGMSVVEYLILRRQELDVRSMFCRGGAGRYYFWGGVNWIAVIVVIGGTAIDLAMLNPVTYVSGPGFGFIGSSLPTVIISGLAYYVLTRLIAVPLGKGGYSIPGRPLWGPVPDGEVTL